MKALAVLVACTLAFTARSEAAGLGSFAARPGARAPLAEPAHSRARNRGDYLLGSTILGDYLPATPDENSAPEGFVPDYVERGPGPLCAPELPRRREARAPTGPRIIYVGKQPAQPTNFVNVIYGVN